MKNSKEIGELLISKGADINAKDILYRNINILFLINLIYSKQRKLNKKKSTPFHYASANNAKEMLELLVPKEADINGKNINLI